MTQLVNVEQMTPAQLDFLQQQIFAQKQAMIQLEMERVKDELAKLQAERVIDKQVIQTLQHRVDNIDCTNIDGSLRDRLNKMIRLYAQQKGIYFNKGYRDFVQFYNTAYRTNLELRITNYCKDHGLKTLSTPEYLERTGRLEDAIRVADKMINKISA